MLFFMACSTHHRYRMMSLFFDGVPAPQSVHTTGADSIAADSTAGPGLSGVLFPGKPQLYFHSGIKSRSCDDCHDPSLGNALMDQQPALCYYCHEDFAEQYEVVHGPVAGGFCTECHNIHQSKSEKLIVRSGQDLCLYCHEAADILGSETHEGLEDTDCMDCHNVHGSDGDYLLE